MIQFLALQVKTLWAFHNSGRPIKQGASISKELEKVKKFYLLSLPLSICLAALCGLMVLGCSNSSRSHGAGGTASVTTDDHSDNPAEATTLALNVARGGELSDGGDVDNFRFRGVAGTEYEVSVKADDEVQLVFGTATGQGRRVGRDIVWSLTPSATYDVVVQVRAYGSTTHAMYSITVREVPPQNPNPYPIRDDHGDDGGFASTLNLNIVTSGEIDIPSDRDVFVFVASGFQNGTKTYEVTLSASAPLNLTVSGQPSSYGISPSIRWSPLNAGPIYITVNPIQGVSTATYTLEVKEVTPQPAPVEPFKFELISSSATEREIPAVGNGTVLQIRAIAQVSSATLTDLTTRFQDPAPEASVSLIKFDAAGNYLGSAGGRGDVFGDVQTLKEQSGNPTLCTTSNVGDYVDIYVMVDVSGRDNVRYTSTLLSASTLDSGGGFYGLAPNLTETVLVEALPEVDFFHPVSTIATVNSGSANAAVTELQMRNRSQLHASSLTSLYVYRETPGDIAPLSLTQGGFLIAQGTEQSYTDHNGNVVRYVYFWIHTGVLNAVPGGTVEVTIEADLTTSNLADIEYTVRSVDVTNDNGQQLGQSIFYNWQSGTHTLFRLEQR